MSDVPVITTPRLILREHRAADLDTYAAIWADPLVARYIGGVCLTREQAWTRMLRYRGMWAMLGFGFWAVEERASGRLIGEIGFQESERDIEPPLRGSLEAGWVLTPDTQRKGLAREAVGAALDWAGGAFADMNVKCIIDVDNAASIAFAGHFGFQEIARVDYHGTPVIIMRA